MATREWVKIKEYEDILFEYYEGIAKITINRPHVYNAFRPQTNKEMLDAMDFIKTLLDLKGDNDLINELKKLKEKENE